MKLKDFSNWLDKLLDPKSFKDYCVDGLCIEANDQVTKVVTGVSFRDRLIDAAIEEKADCILVHHPNGFWHLKNSSAIIAAFSSGVTFMYFRKFASVECPVNLIIEMVGNLRLYIFVAKERLPVCIPIN